MSKSFSVMQSLITASLLHTERAFKTDNRVLPWQLCGLDPTVFVSLTWRRFLMFNPVVIVLTGCPDRLS